MTLNCTRIFLRRLKTQGNPLAKLNHYKHHQNFLSNVLNTNSHISTLNQMYHTIFIWILTPIEQRKQKRLILVLKLHKEMITMKKNR